MVLFFLLKRHFQLFIGGQGKKFSKFCLVAGMSNYLKTSKHSFLASETGNPSRHRGLEGTYLG